MTKVHVLFEHTSYLYSFIDFHILFCSIYCNIKGKVTVYQEALIVDQNLTFSELNLIELNNMN